ncbi:DUF4864 domain-containing protein [Tritonibacter horizontis]|uniref:DUF4864 domain-containing protein n=1 Tax=Tritonibacter horizontis TaxID=1768241 RepID=A0A132BS39_9RHOB|nr:DUF4864 domain-containing protein [Tritonibacter horizontis]KUP90617.1 hypothetical protein TRIHO_44830 [Tritonibacter horizontis]
MRRKLVRTCGVWLAVFICAAGAWLAPARAQSAQSDQIIGVIDAQLEAFQAEDAQAAFGYASPSIQKHFGTPGNFITMVEQGYPMVWRPAEVQYLDLREIAGKLWQRVMMTDKSGGVHLLDYQMVNSGTGWKINAVQLIKAPSGSV